MKGKTFNMMSDGKPAREDGDKVYSSKELFGDRKMVLIRHRDSLYRLVMTKQDKLILNK